MRYCKRGYWKVASASLNLMEQSYTSPGILYVRILIDSKQVQGKSDTEKPTKYEWEM